MGTPSYLPSSKILSLIIKEIIGMIRKVIHSLSTNKYNFHIINDSQGSEFICCQL